jgi:2-hydroxychromene-2-carboxylate isomerase
MVYKTAMVHSAIEFHFDFSSPYSYIASEWIEALAARHGRTVNWHAMLLGATFQAAGVKSPVEHPVKREYTLRDFARSARFEGVPYRQPEVFPIPTQNAARIFWWQTETVSPDAGAAWARACFRAYFTRSVPLNDNGALKALAAESRIDPQAAEAAFGDPFWKARLKAENDAAMAKGIWAAPFFLVEGEPFWGNDRKAQIERWLAKGPF